MVMDKSTKNIAVLFARSDSVYKQFESCDVYDFERNALTYQPGVPIIAHPPCRAWGRLSHFAKPRPGEKELAIWAIWKIRENGGVLEHPAASQLWDELSLPKGQEVDEFGGWTLSIDQSWFGHRARKRTLLYICGISPREIPAYRLSFDCIQRCINTSKKKLALPEVTKPEREATPLLLAEWLIETVSKISVYVNK